MATLAAVTPRNFTTVEYQDYPVVASDKIFEGSLLGWSSGYVRPLVAGDEFAGVAVATADNSSGSAGDITVRCATTVPFHMNVTGATVASNGVAVYASDDDTLTTTEGANSLVGYIVRFVSGTECVIQPEPGFKNIFDDLNTP